jgi:hypothetical protein
MHGTEVQLAAIKDGTYNTDFASIGEQIDQMAGLEEPLLVRSSESTRKSYMDLHTAVWSS